MSASTAGRRRGGGGEEAHADERWLLTYSDMITLLMALFIVMWSISSVNISKFDQLKVSLKSAFSGKIVQADSSVLTGQSSVLDETGSPVTPIVTSNGIPSFTMPSISTSIAKAAAKQDLNNLKHIQQQVQDFAASHGFASQVKTSINQRGLVVHLLTDRVIFNSGDAVLQPSGRPLLSEIAKLLTRADIANPVRVEGNTDSQPIHSSVYPSNWELSTARANAVLEFLLGAGVKPRRLSVGGYGQENPIASNSTASGRAANRRVDLVILRRSFNTSS